jgi:hypothetical protein
MMRFVCIAVLVALGACKDDDRVVYQSRNNRRYTEPTSGQPPIDDMVRVPASADGRVKEFYIDRYEVTAGQYSHCEYRKRCESTAAYEDPCRDEAVNSFEQPDRPMNCVGPREAKQYCRYRGKRLPTRAEWLHAALGDDGRTFPWGNAPPSCKNAVIHDKDCPATKSIVVGSRPNGASPYGAQDMVGNVSEFAFEPPQLHGDGEYVVMGGNYGTSPDTLALGLQQPLGIPASPQIGFRCAWSADMLPSSGMIRGPE